MTGTDGTDADGTDADGADTDGTGAVGGTDEHRDWTVGEPCILVCTCVSCGHRWYLRRPRCPRCAGGVATTPSAGRGTVVATTAVATGGVALVELAEGVRVLGRCDRALRPGDAAVLTLRERPGDAVAVPYFEVENP